MTAYIILVVFMAYLYFFQLKKRAPKKTDWETLPLLEKYQGYKKATNEQGELCCRFCGSTEIVNRELNNKIENPNQDKFYNACSKCHIILWRNEAVKSEEK